MVTRAKLGNLGGGAVPESQRKRQSRTQEKRNRSGGLSAKAIGAGLLAMIPSIAKSFLKPLFNARDLKCFQILERCQTVLPD
ncbi:hypothetical protein P7K49_014081 [Saguinus oedipus]|uniref:Uncharacterized protein n=1 Tax=Saguinus oedipus TaxID=9490 RepID=A0ABQ9VHX1_SAGOE|nr:hypothetical protein P7K49_014081 [Saguinus oedipus]